MATPRGSHFGKNTSGSCLRFRHSGYADALFALFFDAVETDVNLSDKERSKARSIFALAEDWTRIMVSPNMLNSNLPRSLNLIEARLLLLPFTAEGESQPDFAIDGALAERHLAMACAFHDARPWINDLAKKRGWACPDDGTPLKFDPIFAHAASLGKGIRFEESSSENTMGTGHAFALFCPHHGGYLEIPNVSSMHYASPLSRAKLFESAKAAKAFASKKRVGSMVSVVEVQVRALKTHFLLEGANHDALMGAIARAEAAELRALMAQKELEDLREKVKVSEPAPLIKRSGL